MGVETGESIVCPSLQYATQLFIKTNLGVAAQSVGPESNMWIARRVSMGVPTFGLCIDKHATSWDSMQLAEIQWATRYERSSACGHGHRVRGPTGFPVSRSD